MRLVNVKVKFEIRDWWIGLFFDRNSFGFGKIYVCIVPCFPIVFTFTPPEEGKG